MEKCGPQNECFFHPFVKFTSTLVGWLTLLFFRVGWYIMGYESDPLPYYPKLRNCYYSVKLITPHSCLLLRFIYRVLIQPLHHSDLPRNPLRLYAQFIDGLEGHPLCYVCLKSLNVYPDGVENRGFHCLHYRGVVPLCAVSSRTSLGDILV